MNTAEILEALKQKALADDALRSELISTKNSRNPLTDFCSIATQEGLPLYPMDLISYGEEMYAAIKRSTNGGGENSPMLENEDDYYSLFMAAIEEKK